MQTDAAADTAHACTREVKDAQEARDAFKPVSEVTIEMKAKETGTEGAEGKSELTVP